jgi:outer membrane protein OmpA-like peptidoglycan-associated protein
MKTFVSVSLAIALAASVSAGARAAADDDESVSTAPRAAAPADEPAGYLPSRTGPVGLYNVSTAEVGPRDHLRLGLRGEFFSADGLVVAGDHNTELATAFAVGYTPLRYLEIFGGVISSTNRNERTSETGRGDPEVIKSWGDIRLGAKVAGAVRPGFGLGFEAGLRFPPATSSFSFAGDATSVWFGPLAMLDLRRLNGTPLRFHANVSYFVDNSKNVSDFSTATTTTRAVSMFAYGVADSRFRFALGADAPIERAFGSVPLQPFAEYHAEIITADADPAYADLMKIGGRDRHWLTFGLRARVYRGLTVDAGADIRLKSTAVEYGPPLPPYDMMLGVLYPLDIDAFRRPVIVNRTVEKVKEVPVAATDGDVVGTVTDAKDGKPLGAVIVALKGHAHRRVATDPDGTFRLPGVPPGPAELEVTAAAFDTEKVTAAVTAGSTAEVRVTLTPKVVTGVVRGKVTEQGGRGIEAALHFTGAQIYEARSNADGTFTATLTPGVYKLAAEAPGLANKQVPLDVVAGQERQLDLPMRAPNPDVSLQGDTVALRAPIKFRVGTPRLGVPEQAELDGVAALLEDHPEIRVLRVEAHWDASAGLTAKVLTEKQAQTVKDYLVKKGIPDQRIEAVGVGFDHPLVPSIGPANKSKNRRVELHPVY